MTAQFVAPLIRLLEGGMRAKLRNLGAWAVMGVAVATLLPLLAFGAETPTINPEAPGQIGGVAGHKVLFRRIRANPGTRAGDFDGPFNAAATDPKIEAEATDDGVATIAYADNGPASGNEFGAGRDVYTTPGPLTATEGFFDGPERNDDNFAMRSSGYLYIPTAGQWTFRVRSDDSQRLRLGSDGKVVSTFAAARTASTDVVLVTVPSPGYYRYELTWVEVVGGSMFEFSAIAPGATTAFLVGDPHGPIRVFQTLVTPAVNRELVFKKGDQVPGEPTGTVFQTFTQPAINARSELCFGATIRKGKGTVPAVCFGDPPVVSARAGDVAVGTGGARFRSFLDTLLNDAGDYAFIARVAGAGVSGRNDLGLWTAWAGHLDLAARKGDIATGTGAPWSAFQSVALTEDFLVFVATLARGGSIDASNDMGLWSVGRDGTKRLVLREHDSRAGKVVESFRALVPRAGSAGHGGAAARDIITVNLTYVDGTQSIEVLTLGTDATSYTVLSSGEPLPGGSGGESASGFDFPSMNREGANSFAVSLNAGKKRGGAIFAETDQASGFVLTRVVTSGDDAPGLSGDTFSSFLSPVNTNGNCDVAFQGLTRKRTQGIWRRSSGVMQAVALAGENPPELPGAVYRSFSALACSPAGELGPIFGATVRLPGGSKPANGIWGFDGYGALRLLAYEGQVLEGGYSVRKLKVLTSQPHSPRQGGEVNSRGEVVGLATLPGSATAILKLRLPVPSAE